MEKAVVPKSADIAHVKFSCNFFIKKKEIRLIIFSRYCAQKY